MLNLIITTAVLIPMVYGLFQLCLRNHFIHLNWITLKYEHAYNLLGLKTVVEDFISRKQNDSFVAKKKCDGKVALITGGARGIGAEVVKSLLNCDLHVIIGCRNVSAADDLLVSIRQSGIKDGEMQAFKLDISSMESVRLFAKTVQQEYPKIDILINNAGIMFRPYIETEDGFESQFATNYLGHFLLSHLLLPQLKAAGSSEQHARIVNVSSCAHELGKINFEDINHKKFYIASSVYGQSKLAQVLFTNYLNLKLAKAGIPVSVFTIHPGLVNTDLFNNAVIQRFGSLFMRLCFKTPKQGAQSILFASLSPDVEELGGNYISNCEIVPMAKIAYSLQLQAKLFEFTKQLLNIENFNNYGF